MGIKVQRINEKQSYFWSIYLVIIKEVAKIMTNATVSNITNHVVSYVVAMIIASTHIKDVFARKNARKNALAFR